MYEDTLRAALHGRKLRALCLHPVLEHSVLTDVTDTGASPLAIPRRRLDWRKFDTEAVPDAEEAIGLCRAVKWDILPGPRVPRGGWKEEELVRAEFQQLLNRRSYHMPDGTYLDPGDAQIEEDNEYVGRGYFLRNIMVAAYLAIRRDFLRTSIVGVLWCAPWLD